jgi:NADPH:quinone reductase and related Zn-dependent oxidoreductases
MDFCGRVVTYRPGAGFKPGQLVYGCHSMPMKFGALAEYLSISAKLIAPVPEGVSVDDAASLGIAGQSAYQALDGYVKKGDKVFINGGSGGCGIFAIQIAKHMGCFVAVTCSTKNVELCYRLGADEVIDYTAVGDLVGALKKKGVVYDHILDHIGLPSNLYFQCHHFLRPGGVFVQVGASALTTFVSRVAWPSFLGGGKRRYLIFFFKNTQAHTVKLGELVQKGALKLQFDSKFAFEDAVKAFEKLRSGRARGKVLVHVATPRRGYGCQRFLFHSCNARSCIISFLQTILILPPTAVIIYDRCHPALSVTEAIESVHLQLFASKLLGDGSSPPSPHDQSTR